LLGCASKFRGGGKIGGIGRRQMDGNQKGEQEMGWDECGDEC
jgi:hypothetical protein